MVKIYPRLLPKPKDSFFLLGMRGIGKSTWVRGEFGTQVTKFDLLDEDLYSELLVKKSNFYDQLVGSRPGSWVVVDEIQRLPGLLNECHRLMEERRIKFALLGSSARKLRSQGTNLLGGRADSIELLPLTPEELGKDFKLDHYLRFGGIPLILTSEDPASRLKAYVQTYLREEIQQEALVRNLEGFARFLPVAGLFHGQVLNVEGLARDAGVARTTVQGYLNILEDTLLAYRLKAFEGRLRVKETRHPKLYWVDPGVARASKKQFGPVAPEERGALFEGIVVQLLRTYQALRQDLFDDIFYWSVGKSSSAIEVDVLLLREREIVAIEIKSGEKFQSGWTLGLKAIDELREVKRRILVYGGERSFRTADGIEVVSFKDLSQMLINGKL